VTVANSNSSLFHDIGLWAYCGHDLTFRGHVTSSVTWPCNSPWAISYWWSFETESLSPAFLEILSILGSRVVTIWFLIGNFLLMAVWNQVSISNGLWDIRWLMWRNGSRDLKRPLNKGQGQSFWYPTDGRNIVAKARPLVRSARLKIKIWPPICPPKSLKGPQLFKYLS